MRKKAAAAADRRGSIDAQISLLASERAEIVVLEDQLRQLLEVEERYSDLRAAARGAELPLPRDPSPETASHDLIREPLLRNAAAPAGRGTYDLRTRCFVIGEQVGGSCEASRIVLDPVSGVDVGRLVKMLEVPGLVHAMVMGHMAQVVIDVDASAASVPVAALGLPMVGAYVDHCFSIEALDLLCDPQRSDDFLAEIRKPGRGVPS